MEVKAEDVRFFLSLLYLLLFISLVFFLRKQHSRSEVFLCYCEVEIFLFFGERWHIVQEMEYPIQFDPVIGRILPFYLEILQLQLPASFRSQDCDLSSFRKGKGNTVSRGITFRCQGALALQETLGLWGQARVLWTERRADIRFRYESFFPGVSHEWLDTISIQEVVSIQALKILSANTPYVNGGKAIWDDPTLIRVIVIPALPPVYLWVCRGGMVLFVLGLIGFVVSAIRNTKAKKRTPFFWRKVPRRSSAMARTSGLLPRSLKRKYSRIRRRRRRR